MKHLITTRIKFKDEQLMDKYLTISKKYFIPSIFSQTNKNFILGIFANNEHREMIQKIFDDYAKTNNLQPIKCVFFNNMNLDYVEYVKKENINIQTRHDCDDWMDKDYVESIQNIHINNIGKYQSIVVHVQPYKVDSKTDNKYKMSFRYSDKATSMFVSLCQSNCNNSVFSLKHGQIGSLGKKCFLLDEGKCWLVIHDNNKLSTITKYDYEIPKKDNTKLLQTIIKK